MKRLELGDDYHSSDTEESKPAEDDDDDFDSYGEESQIQDGPEPSLDQQSPELLSPGVNDDGNSSMRKGASIARLSESHTIAVE